MTPVKKPLHSALKIGPLELKLPKDKMALPMATPA